MILLSLSLVPNRNDALTSTRREAEGCEEQGCCLGVRIHLRRWLGFAYALRESEDFSGDFCGELGGAAEGALFRIHSREVDILTICEAD
jgi:hypothetical protein